MAMLSCAGLHHSDHMCAAAAEATQTCFISHDIKPEPKAQVILKCKISCSVTQHLMGGYTGLGC